MSKYPFDKNLRDIFLKRRARYKKICREAEKNARRSLIKALVQVGKADPKNFWNIIDKMNKWGKGKEDPTDKILPNKWKKHFEELLTDGNKEEVSTKHLHMNRTFDPAVDGIITEKEVEDALKKMKCKKSPGPDGILTEYLKIFGAIAGNILLKLIRTMFAHHIYPSIWRLNFLKPIHKKGDKEDPHNFRGLAIASALAKLHGIILLQRLKNYIHDKRYISPNQIGFMDGAQTSDHIFLLQTIVEKVVKKNRRKLFCVFVDFKKAYDTVDRKILLRKLQNIGINGIFYKNIESMYMDTEYSIKLKNGFLDPIKSNLGLRQGCPLSPILFNIYIDDVKNIFDERCDPIDVHGKQINHFLYADDLIILSLSKQGLQNCLNRLQEYSRANRLTINIAKTKSMIFNHTGKLIKENIFLDNKKLEQVLTFCYLGFDVKASGVVSSAISTLYDKANKAMRPLMGIIYRFNIPIRISIKLFHTFISPIMLYTTENWVFLSDRKLRNFTEDSIFLNTHKDKIDILHRHFLKSIMGTSKSCPNIAVYGETEEIPLSLKAFRLMLNYWYRITNLPEDTLVKRALLENIHLRTNWITTIEKLTNLFDLTDLPRNLSPKNLSLFKTKTYKNIRDKYILFWAENKEKDEASRTQFYDKIKTQFSFENYLEIPNFSQRQAIAKLRCSDHKLEIEKGRHNKVPKEERLCRVCDSGEIETEEHFLIKCKFYDNLKLRYQLVQCENMEILLDTNPQKFGRYLIDAFEERKIACEPPFS